MSKIVKKAKEVFDIEIEGLQHVRDRIDGKFESLVKACVKVLDNGGKIVISGVGKSGHVGHKIAATLASTGSPAVFMHPVEAMHGDFGLMQKDDILIILSYSGESEEVLCLIPSVKRLGVPVASITGDPDSRLAQFSDIVIDMTVPREACPFNLAPTTTTTVLIALGDALAMTLLELRSFKKEDYGRLHPGGAIGKAVTMRASDVMRKGDKVAIVSPDMSVKDTLLEMTRARCGSAIVVDKDRKLLGIFTDGDFRRHIENDLGILQKNVFSVMTKNPTSVKASALAVEVLKIVETRHIDDIIVIGDDGKVAGLVDIQDLPGLKLM